MLLALALTHEDTLLACSYFADSDGLILKGSLKLEGAAVRGVTICAKETPRHMGQQIGFELKVSTHVMLAFPAEELPSTKVLAFACSLYTACDGHPLPIHAGGASIQ